ncbi:MAG TPA: fused acetyl/propionyl-CoA carboxylase subunit alpha/methylmalonyl-CoA decarboxylase subunit alpha, partial [Propionibacteriaceae bacterium]|nr:fused acetyl/propionyl-CoA carboxylase subunit alpha/methylmalonyl-CoA decarboxylase subunit alpha [Propionibacteriaceae bacterium]
IVLGFDADPGEPAALLARYLEARPDTAAALLAEAEILGIFADIAELHRNRPSADQADADVRVHTTREYFQRYLHSLDVEREQLPATFADRLARVLAHYGVEGLDRTPELEAAVFRIFLVQERWAPALTVVTGLLSRWNADAVPAGTSAMVRQVLSRLVVATQRRFPAVGDLARAIRYRWFDRPTTEAERAATLAQVPRLLERLAELPDGPTRRAVTEELVSAPDRLVGFLRARALDQDAPPEEPLLGILAQRHYRGYALGDITERSTDGRAVVTADYTIGERFTRLVSAVGTLPELLAGGALSPVVRREVDGRAPGQQAVVDLYLTCQESPEPDVLAADLARALEATDWFPLVRRVAIAVLPLLSGTVSYYTFRPRTDGAVEDRILWGVHPMIGRQLNLWRLSNFELARVDAPHGILLLHATARSNPEDQRLIALAQVRRLSILRDERGTVSGLPELERALVHAVEAVRRARADSAPVRQLDHNHVWIHVWGEFEVDLRSLGTIERALAPVTADAGITEVRIQSMVLRPGTDSPTPTVIRFSHQPGFGVRFQIQDPATEPLAAAGRYDELVLRARRRGLVYPYELFGLVSSSRGTATELDLDASGALVPVRREPGLNTAGIICADVSTPTESQPEGVRRIVLFGDPLKAL